jgi:Zn-finger nucleic acid-binding protein
MFIGSRHCPHCGAAAERAEVDDAKVLKCPRCRLDMTALAIGAAMLRECEQCSGLWVETRALEKICADREQQAAVLGKAGPLPAPSVQSDPSQKIRYVPCPQCSQLMNRINFARCSGVVVDVCKGHGTWFDAEELRRIIEFIRAGGLDSARAREKQEIEEQRRQLTAEQLAAARATGPLARMRNLDDERASGLSSVGGLLKILLD